MFVLFDNREEGDGAIFDAHFDGESAADLAMVDLERPHFGFALGDGDVARTIVAHEDQIFVEVDSVVLGK